MTNEGKNKIIDRVIDFLENKTTRNNMRMASALIEELKLVKNCSIPTVSVAKRKVCPKCGETKEIEHIHDHYDCHSCGDEF